jgi:hypothetical protein
MEVAASTSATAAAAATPAATPAATTDLHCRALLVTLVPEKPYDAACGQVSVDSKDLCAFHQFENSPSVIRWFQTFATYALGQCQLTPYPMSICTPCLFRLFWRSTRSVTDVLNGDRLPECIVIMRFCNPNFAQPTKEFEWRRRHTDAPFFVPTHQADPDTWLCTNVESARDTVCGFAPCVKWSAKRVWRGMTQAEALESARRMGFSDNDLSVAMVKSALVSLAQYMHKCCDEEETVRGEDVQNPDVTRRLLLDGFSLIQQYFEMRHTPSPLRRSLTSASASASSPCNHTALPLPMHSNTALMHTLPLQQQDDPMLASPSALGRSWATLQHSYQHQHQHQHQQLGHNNYMLDEMVGRLSCDGGGGSGSGLMALIDTHQRMSSFGSAGSGRGLSFGASGGFGSSLFGYDSSPAPFHLNTAATAAAAAAITTTDRHLSGSSPPRVNFRREGLNGRFLSGGSPNPPHTFSQTVTTTTTTQHFDAHAPPAMRSHSRIQGVMFQADPDEFSQQHQQHQQQHHGGRLSSESAIALYGFDVTAHYTQQQYIALPEQQRLVLLRLYPHTYTSPPYSDSTTPRRIADWMSTSASSTPCINRSSNNHQPTAPPRSLQGRQTGVSQVVHPDLVGDAIPLRQRHFPPA